MLSDMHSGPLYGIYIRAFSMAGIDVKIYSYFSSGDHVYSHDFW